MKELERLVSNGAGLMIFCGELMDTTSYNERLFADGKGLLPVKLDGPADGTVRTDWWWSGFREFAADDC